MVARPKEVPTPRSGALLGGALGGILGTSGMILAGIGAEGSARVPLARLAPVLELGFGGPLAGAGVLGSGFSLPVHLLHGVILGLVFAGIVALVCLLHLTFGGLFGATFQQLRPPLSTG